MFSMLVTREYTISIKRRSGCWENWALMRKKMITVLNKVDLIRDESTLHALRLHFPDGAFVSVRYWGRLEGASASDGGSTGRSRIEGRTCVATRSD